MNAEDFIRLREEAKEQTAVFSSQTINQLLDEIQIALTLTEAAIAVHMAEVAIQTKDQSQCYQVEDQHYICPSKKKLMKVMGDSPHDA